jgi:hypothetical protein
MTNDGEESEKERRSREQLAYRSTLTKEELALIKAGEDRLTSVTPEANLLIKTLETERPDLWAAYLKQEQGSGQLSNKTVNWILDAQRKLFPGLTLNQYGLILGRMRDLIAIYLGQREPD